MLVLKRGVNPAVCHPALLVALIVIDGAYRELGFDCVVTSLFDGTHKPDSLHTRDGVCRAADLRTKTLPRMDVPRLVDRIRWALGADYDVILEKFNEDGEHLHVEYDPKGGDKT